MNKIVKMLIPALSLAAAMTAFAASEKLSTSYAGSKSCRECHERFHQLWSTSFHGLAMQPFTAELAKTRLTPQSQALSIGEYTYRANLSDSMVIETGANGEKHYPIEYAMGGKNIYYFLTTLEKGRIQTLPVSYDVRRKEWFDTALSGARHYPGQLRPSEPISWKSSAYTFNTACRDCHISQRNTSYDPKLDRFNTTWNETGINCETCHGPSEEHNQLMRKIPKGQKPVDFKLIRTKTFTPAQHNDACNSCHAKMAHITGGYRTPERFFDHFDLVTLENPDFYPDGRDLGENYTMTGWMLNPCGRKSGLNCVTCHTSSGRYRFRKPEDAEKACLPCHEERVKNITAHSHHAAGSAGNHCVACHMPKTEFARMLRSDHSMLPPTPATTIRFKSPNACNICHSDKDATWADQQVRKWYPRDYQAPIVKRAELVEAARKKDWNRLPEILAYISDPSSSEIFSASLIRLMDVVKDPRTVPVLMAALKHSSPLIRAASADTLAQTPTPEVLQALMIATGDDYRLVRISAVGSLGGHTEITSQEPLAQKYKSALQEYQSVLSARPVNWTSHYNLGNIHLQNKQFPEAIKEYETALNLEPKATLALINAATALAQTGDIAKAEEYLKKVLIIDGNIAVAHYNLGMFAAGRNEMKKAGIFFEEAFKADPLMADAAFNRCLVAAQENDRSGLSWCQKAATANPEEPKFAYSIAVYQLQSGDEDDAAATLLRLIKQAPSYADAYLLLGKLYEKSGRPVDAQKIYDQLLSQKNISDISKGP